jgi:hypothetical protein
LLRSAAGNEKTEFLPLAEIGVLLQATPTLDHAAPIAIGGGVIQSFQNTVAGCGTRQACLGISDEMKKQVSALALPGV